MADIDTEITLREITKETLRDILKLKVSSAQEQFVTSNATSIAEAHFRDEAWFRGIYAGAAVGFVMLYLDPDGPSYDLWLWRFMIDTNHQRRGYGRRALELAIDHVRSLPGATTFFTSYVPGEGSPAAFYRTLGFVDTGEVSYGKNVMRLQLEGSG